MAGINMILFSIYETAKIVSLLGRLVQTPELYMLSRSLIEKIINYSLCILSEEYAEAMLSYSNQKGYRVLNRQHSAGGFTINQSFFRPEDEFLSEKLKKDLAKFTGPKGREVTKWTKLSTYERIDKILELWPSFNALKYLTLLVATYENSSESLHGTLYGTSFYFGAFHPNATSNFEEMINIKEEHCLTSMAYSVIAISEMIRLISIKIQIPDILKNSDNEEQKVLKNLRTYSESLKSRRTGTTKYTTNIIST